MAPVTRFLSLAIVATAFQSCLAGPACSRKHYGTPDCVKKCKSRWALPGSDKYMGNNRWGNVVNNSNGGSLNATISKACGAATSTGTTQPLNQTASATSPISTSVLASSSVTVSVTQPSSSATSPTSITRPATSTRSPASSPPSTTKSTSPVAPPPAQITSTTSSTPQPPVATTKAPVQAPSPTSNPAGGSSGDKQAYLDAHNAERAKHGASPLTWSDTLAAAAQRWANRCVFEHSGGQLGPFGENLAAGTGTSYDIRAAFKSWADEAKDYVSGKPSHWTQVVWKGSKELGCAVALCDGIFPSSYGKAKYFVCEYSPAGNVIGQFDKNVQV